MNNGSSQFDDIDKFLHTNHYHQSSVSQVTKLIMLPQVPQFFQNQAITQDQLLAQNARLLQQLQEQQRLISWQTMLATKMLPTQFIPEIANKKIRKSQSALNRITSNASLSNAVPIQEIKGNVKNAYIKKITSLLSVDGGQQLLEEEELEDLEEIQESEESPNKAASFRLAGLLGSQNDLLDSDAKNKRLRQSAKKSRLRKKYYLRLLENRVSKLDQRIEEFKKKTKDSFDFLQKLLTTHPVLNNIIIGQSQAMEQVLQCHSPDQAQLVLDSYLMRYGTCGIKRRDYVKYAIKNIQRNYLKGNYGVMLISMKPGENQSYDEEFNGYVEILKSLAQVDDENLTYKALPTIDKLLTHRKNSQNLLQRLNEECKKLKLVQQQIEENVNQFTQSLTPMQHIELIKQVDKLGSFNKTSL